VLRLYPDTHYLGQRTFFINNSNASSRFQILADALLRKGSKVSIEARKVKSV